LDFKVKVVELEGVMAEKNEELGKANGRIQELERLVAEANDRLDKLSTSLGEGVASYKALVIESNPDVLEGLVTGDSIKSINNSLVSARELVSKVRKGIEAEISLVKIPAGAPQRTSIDLSALSPREKIQYAIGGKR
jgi:hypothetical protein